MNRKHILRINDYACKKESGAIQGPAGYLGSPGADPGSPGGSRENHGVCGLAHGDLHEGATPHDLTPPLSRQPEGFVINTKLVHLVRSTSRFLKQLYLLAFGLVEATKAESHSMEA